MDRSTRQQTEERVVDIVEVNPSANTIQVRDSYSTLLNVSIHFQDPILVMPKVQERWIVERRGNEWFLKKKAENGTSIRPFSKLAPGDVRIEGEHVYVLGDTVVEGDITTDGTISFTDDTTLERLSSGTLGVNGTAIVLATSQAFPPGGIIQFGGAIAPTGWVLCDGSAISRSTYSALFGIIGGFYGVGDGTTTFNVPDLRQRIPLGKAVSGTGSTLGETGGAIDHTHSGPSHTHTGPSHTHSTPNHSHSGTTGTTASTTSLSSGATTSVIEPHTHPFTTNTDGGSTTGAAGTGATGAGGTGATSAANPPYLTLNFIIKL